MPPLLPHNQAGGKKRTAAAAAAQATRYSLRSRRWPKRQLQWTRPKWSIAAAAELSRKKGSPLDARGREGGEQEKGLSLSALIQTDENRAREEAPRKAAAAAVAAAPISYLSVE